MVAAVGTHGHHVGAFRAPTGIYSISSIAGTEGALYPIPPTGLHDNIYVSKGEAFLSPRVCVHLIVKPGNYQVTVNSTRRHTLHRSSASSVRADSSSQRDTSTVSS